MNIEARDGRLQKCRRCIKNGKVIPERIKCLEPTIFRSFNFVLKFKFQIQFVFGREPICPSNRANHDWGSLSGAMDDTHKSQKCTCIPQAFWFGKQARALSLSSLEWHAEAKQTQTRQRTPKCPPQFCPDALSALKTQIETNGWLEVDVHTHFYALQSGLATCTRRDMHGLQNKPRKTTMSDDTWLLVCTKRKWRQNVAECQTLQKRTLLRAILATWKHACLRQEDVINQSPKCFHGV